MGYASSNKPTKSKNKVMILQKYNTLPYLFSSFEKKLPQMKEPAKPFDEAERLDALYSYQILDTEEEQEYDEIVSLASYICGTPISLISLVDENRQWFKARIGLSEKETSRNISFCSHAINHEEILLVKDASLDIRFRENPLVTGNPMIRFYAGMPLVSPSGKKIGTLCVLNTVPQELDEKQLEALKILSKQVIKQMELRKKNERLKLLNQNANKLISIISHEFKSPLVSLDGLLRLFRDNAIEGKEFYEWIPSIENSLGTALHLSENILKWVDTQLGGRKLTKFPHNLNEIFQFSVSAAQTQAQAKQNTIGILVPEGLTIFADRGMVELVLNNLLINANKFSSGSKIMVLAEARDGRAIISVKDNGVGMSESKLNNLFNWESRRSSSGTNGERGSGFGLLICKDFVEANDGQIWAESQLGQGTAFFISLPLESKFKV
jgi:signal transduction histidine kinase